MHDIELIKLPDGTIQINASQCGVTFEGIAFIHEPNTRNPLLSIPKPVGSLAVLNLLTTVVERLREQYPDERINQFGLLNCIDALGAAYYSLDQVLKTAPLPKPKQ